MSNSDTKIYKFGVFSMDVENCLLIKDDVRVSLTSKGCMLLMVLVKNKGKVVDKHELLDTVWPQARVGASSLSGQISRLRKVLGEKPGENRFIATVPGRGYCFVGDTLGGTEENRCRPERFGKQDKEFERAVDYVMEKNAELYRRLA
jgi:DNA-binding winged helix-turn-helix (wHTH) protein